MPWTSFHCIHDLTSISHPWVIEPKLTAGRLVWSLRTDVPVSVITDVGEGLWKWTGGDNSILILYDVEKDWNLLAWFSEMLCNVTAGWALLAQKDKGSMGLHYLHRCFLFLIISVFCVLHRLFFLHCRGLGFSDHHKRACV